MPKLIPALNIADKKRVLRDFNPENDLWILSDIKSQSFVLSQLQQKKSLKNKSCVMRAKDFWAYLLSVIHPEIRLLPRSFLNSYLSKMGQIP